jgi:hypothetical protein
MKEVKTKILKTNMVKKFGGPGSGPNPGDSRGSYNTKGDSKKPNTPAEIKVIKENLINKIIQEYESDGVPFRGKFLDKFKDKLGKMTTLALEKELRDKRKSGFEKAVSEMQKGDIATGAKLDYIKYGD